MHDIEETLRKVRGKKIVWMPLSGIKDIGASAQFFAYTVEASEILLHGTRGSGKTAVHLMRYARGLNRGWGSYWKGAIIARKSSGLQDIEAQSKRLFYNLGGRYLSSASNKRWIFPNGEELLFLHVEKEGAFQDKFLGQEFAWLGFNELTLFEEDIYHLVKTSNRSSFSPEKDTPVLLDRFGNPVTFDDGSPMYVTRDGRIAPKINLEVCSTTNSEGTHMQWVKRYFIDDAPAGVIQKKKSSVMGEETEVTKIHIFSSWVENIQKNGGYLPNSYILTLKQSCKGNKNREKSWIEGSWDITSGGIFDDLWCSSVHVIRKFTIPHSWRLRRVFDWGSSQPFYVGWFAEADGTEAVLPDGRRWCPPSGTLVLYDEWYGGDIDKNEGLQMSSKDVAKGIIQREHAQLERGLIHPSLRGKKDKTCAIINNGIADGAIFNQIDPSYPSIAETMEAHGVYFEKADKSSGSRVLGVQLIRDRLYEAIQFVNPRDNESVSDAGAGLFFFEHCKAAITLLPIAPRCPKNPDDVDTTSNDHGVDVARYVCLDCISGGKKVSSGKVRGLTS